MCEGAEKLESIEVTVVIDDPRRLAFMRETEEWLPCEMKRERILLMGLDALEWKERFTQLICEGLSMDAAYQRLSEIGSNG